jgi:hypothetical protein
MAEQAIPENVSENAPNPGQIIRRRLDDLLARRAELEERLQRELALAIAPLDASIKELRWTLSQMEGTADAPAPQYNLVKRASSPAAPPPVENVVAHQFAPARPAPAAKAAPPQVVRSPKTGTPVATNVAILRRKIRGS